MAPRVSRHRTSRKADPVILRGAQTAGAARVSRIPVAPAVLAFCLLTIAVGHPASAAGQTHSSPPYLEFRGLQVGVPIPDLRTHVRALAGTLSCRPSRDPRLDECTGSVRLVPGGPHFSLIVSSVRDSAAVVILTGAAPRDTVADWAESIAWVQGRVLPRTRGPQLIWQWVRYRQMMRLIHRQEGSGDVLTVTLTDGPLLDNLGGFRLRPPR